MIDKSKLPNAFEFVVTAGQRARQLFDAAAGQYGAGVFGVLEILELPRHRCNPPIEYAPGDGAGLAQHFRGLLGVALRFIAKP